MQCIYFSGQPAPRPPDWDEFTGHDLICHDCEKALPGFHPDLYYFPEVDMMYHKHPDERYYRAFIMLNSRTVQIGVLDSQNEMVIQAPVIEIMSGAKVSPPITLQEAKSRGTKFFKMLNEKRIIADKPPLRFSSA